VADAVPRLIDTFESPDEFRQKFIRHLAARMVEYLKSLPSSESNWQEAPILEIQDLEIKNQFTAEKGPHFIVSFMIANVGNVVCQTHLVTIRIPLKFGSTPVVIDDEQPPFNGRVSHYVDTESQSAAYVLELRGGKIYSGNKVTKALKILPVPRFGDRLSA
jgi:hypothetical protein